MRSAKSSPTERVILIRGPWFLYHVCNNIAAEEIQLQTTIHIIDLTIQVILILQLPEVIVNLTIFSDQENINEV